MERIGRPPHFVSILLLGTLSWEIGACVPLAPARSGQANPRSIDRILINARWRSFERASCVAHVLKEPIWANGPLLKNVEQRLALDTTLSVRSQLSPSFDWSDAAA